MDSKRGILGGTMVTFVATITIVIILLIFSLGAAFVKVVDDSAEGLKVYNETDVGLENIFGYMDNYLKLVKVRFKVEDGTSVTGALLEVGYEK